MSKGREQVRVNSVRVCLSGLRRRRRRSPQPPLRAVRVWVGEQLGIAKVHGRVQVDVRPGGNLVAGEYLRNGISVYKDSLKGLYVERGCKDFLPALA